MAPPGTYPAAKRPLPLPPGFAEHWSRVRPAAELEEAAELLREERDALSSEAMRATTPSRLSFAHSLVRRMGLERWKIELSDIKIDGDATGSLTYVVNAGGETFHLGVVSRPAVDGPRQGRLRENEFDFYGFLMDGPPDPERLLREYEEASTRVWRGRTSSDVYGWTFANRSDRLFAHVVDRLAEGRQPDQEALRASGGYIVRNAGFYGNGRHGTRAWLTIPAGHPLDYPYHVDLFCLYLWRNAGFDIAEAAARARSRDAAVLAPDVKRHLGVGNSSGIGTVAALVRWPSSLSGFTFAREIVLAYAKSRRSVDAARVSRLAELLERDRCRYVEEPPRKHGGLDQPEEIVEGLDEIARLVEELGRRGTIAGLRTDRPFLALADATSRVASREASERLNTLLIELYPNVADEVADFIPQLMRLRRSVTPEMTVAELRRHVRERYGWALAVDLRAPGAREHFWYKSEENGENRRGVRGVDPGVEYETFVDVVGAVQELASRLDSAPDGSVGRFLLQHPQDALIVSRVQMAAMLPYAELQENVVDAGFLPSDAIRFFLSILGIERPNPVSVQWVRGVFFQAAPLAEDLGAGIDRDSTFTERPAEAGEAVR